MSKGGNRFTAGAFIRDNAVFIALTMALVSFMTFILSGVRMPAPGIAVIDGVIIVGAAAYLSYENLRRAAFWSDLEESAEALDRAEHITDLLEEPDFLEGRVAYDALRSVAVCAGVEAARLRETSRANSDYVNAWVHEVKTPIAASRLIAEKMHGEDADALKRELERTEALVQQALYASRVDSLSHDYLIRELDLAEIVRESCKSNMHYLMSLGVSIDVRIAPDVTVFADKSWLGFIITQLLTNSAKYEAQSITVTALVPDRESSSSCTVLEVGDDGCGIPAADVPRVFERGFTGEVGRAHGSATGMGLYLAARMCEQMGIGIVLASEDGVGTRVELSFPHDRRRMRLLREDGDLEPDADPQGCCQVFD